MRIRSSLTDTAAGGPALNFGIAVAVAWISVTSGAVSVGLDFESSSDEGVPVLAAAAVRPTADLVEAVAAAGAVAEYSPMAAMASLR